MLKTKIDTSTAIIPTTSAAEPMTSGDHLIAADKLIGDAARATYARIRETQGEKAAKAQRGHLDAACSFAQAGEAAFMVAEWLAEGRTGDDDMVQLYIRVAEAKGMEGLRRIAGLPRR